MWRWNSGVIGLGAAVLSAHALTVRVECPNGAPRLVVDGKPVRARMFWGAPGSAPIPVTDRGEEKSFEFTALETETRTATMHFRFGHVPGDVYLDDIRVLDLDTGRDVIPLCDFANGQKSFTDAWTFWPTGAQNTVGMITVTPKVGRNGSAGLHIKLVAPKDGHWPGFHIYHRPDLALRKGHHYRASFWVSATPGRSLTVAFYRPGRVFTYLGGLRGPFQAQIKLAAQAGVNFVSFPIGFPWPRPGEKADWTSVDARCRSVLDANPNALLLPRMGMGPPQWWRKAHPNDVMVWEDGARNYGAVVASPRYRKDAAARLSAFVSHLEETFGDHVAGYHPCGQNTGEWFYRDTWGHPLNGYSKASERAWRLWLKQRYGGDASLRRAWGDATVACSTATVPSPAARHAAPFGTFRDPGKERPLIDFTEFQQEAMADCVCDLAHAVREASHGRKLVVFFYGYVFEFGAVGNGPGTSGHYALRRVLNSPDIDVLCSPISYFDRGLGGSAPAMTAAESVELAHKMWLFEDDTATYLSTGTPPGSRERVTTLAQTNNQLVRNVAEEAMRNFGTWWMDLTATGWFNDPRMWAEMVRLKALDDPLLEKLTPFRPQVAAIIDDESMIHVAARGTGVTRPGVYEVRAPLARTGAPYGQYLLDDVTAGRVSARLCVFLTAWVLSTEQRTELRKATQGKTSIWCYAPGYIADGRPSTEAMQDLTGFRMQKVSPETAMATPTATGRELGLRQPFGASTRIRPLFAVADAGPGEVLATYPDGSAAVVMRHTNHGVSIFVGAPGLTSELLRLAARSAGVHLFTDTDCIVYANGPFVVLHAPRDGVVTLHTGKASPVVDVFSGKPEGEGPDVDFHLKLGDTRVLRY